MTTRLKLQIERDGAQVVSIDITGDDAVVSALLATASEEQGKARFRDEFNGGGEFDARKWADDGVKHGLLQLDPPITAPSVEVPAGLLDGPTSSEAFRAHMAPIHDAFRARAEAIRPGLEEALNLAARHVDHEHTPETLDDGAVVCAECGEVLAAEEDQA